MASVGVAARAGFTGRQWAGVAVSALGLLCAGLAAWVAWLEAVGALHIGWAVLLPLGPAAVLLHAGNALLPAREASR